MKVAELLGADLDFAVARAEGIATVTQGGGAVTVSRVHGTVYLDTGAAENYIKPFAPSTDWAHGGPIIERERIAIEPWKPDGWLACWASVDREVDAKGATPLEAAMRAYVASKFGEEVTL